MDLPLCVRQLCAGSTYLSSRAAAAAAVLLFAGLVSACGSGSSADGSLAPDTGPVTSTPLAQKANVTLNIMPLGDSITQSVTPLNSYRYYLWHLLINQGYRVDFVGSRKGVGGGPPGNPDFDIDHEGHAGWRADEILANVQVWATQASPDVVLLHIGHNDLCRGQGVASTVIDIGNIIDELRSVNPHVRILLAQLIASASTCHSEIPSLNTALRRLAAEKDAADSFVTLVDQYTGFDPPTMTFDGTHPNAIGDSRIADRWFEQLAPVLDSILTNSTREERKAGVNANLLRVQQDEHRLPAIEHIGELAERVGFEPTVRQIRRAAAL
jgi:lysophospholipase L1-like esterase